jgi:hypothetical protein
VPDLARDGDWIETPFWGWRSDRPRRGRLFVRGAAGAIGLRCGPDSWPSLKADSTAALVRSWRELQPAGFKVRTRALSLTLFTRLCLADLFVHGLGGGKYDEVTDAIIRGFFGIEAPAYLVVTGTLRLPLPRHGVDQDDYRRLAWRLRDLTFNPQRHIAADARLTPAEMEAAMTKAVLIPHEPLRHKERKDRFFQMRQLNEALQPLVAAQRQEAENALRALTEQLQENAVSARRDYAFCLYPEEKLRAFLTQ